MASSYQIYTNWKNAKTYNDELKAGSNEDYLQDKIYENIKMCFDGIYDTASYNKKYYFNLKANWKLLKAHDYDAVIENIQQWLLKADSRFDGEKWTENHFQIKNGENKTIIKDEAKLEEICQILINGEGGLIFKENSDRYVSYNDLEFEVDDEDYDRIYFDIGRVKWSMFCVNAGKVIADVLLENNIVDFKINMKLGEIKFYQ